jgi:hypothetical protein
MGFELDHIFVMTDANAPEAGALIDLGLAEGDANRHAGQGTANRRFFFANAMLELLWVDDSRDAQSAAVARTRLWERWRDRRVGACPFGFCVRGAAGQVDSPAPFATWDYHPLYLPAGASIAIGCNSGTVTEPLLFYLRGGARPDSIRGGGRRPPLVHATGWREITRVTWFAAHPGEASRELAALIASGVIGRAASATAYVELGFDHESQGRAIDLRPHLPLVCSY